ncbi:helix-turn-helix domain-containing protein [Streptomyces sp. NPDC059095]|uniref:helix-turn-helix domain-containing protein n=1 Tax=Streptomyces sp. NPDC059095 TaxID=3346726 RepID=UPI00369CB21A
MLFNGKRAAALRLTSGRTIRGLAAAANISRSTLRAAERGLRQPHERVVRALAKALGVPRHELLLPSPPDGVSLAEIRRSLGLTQKEMAKRIGHSPTTVWQVERGGHVQLPLEWAAAYALTLPHFWSAHAASRDLVRGEAAARAPRRTTHPRGERA